MSAAQEAMQQLRQRAASQRPRRPAGLAWRAAETAWAIAFLLPYGAVLAAFIAYPLAFGVWMGSRPSLYATLFSDPRYWDMVASTLLFVGIGVNAKMALAFLLSGFFLTRNRWIRALLPLYMLPWALPALSAFLSIHYMLVSQWGLLDSLWRAVTGEDGPLFLVSPTLALGANVVSYVWKWLPFWTLVFLAARLAIPREILEAAAVDGATPWQRLRHVTFPLLAGVYLTGTVLSCLWTLGDFSTVYFVSSGAPGRSTDVLATYAFHEAYDFGYPALAMAAMMSALPVMLPLVVLLMRRVRRTGIQL